ncbi:MAG: hypothetical protein HY293_05860 [Planctomycetes bacterium]|nr:hypothetical protein [Planctomycetota bacterium]
MQSFLALPLALCGCGYMGHARPWDPGSAADGFEILQGLDPILQYGSEGCGPAALAMLLRHIAPGSEIDPPPGERGSGVTARELRDFARARSYDTHLIQGSISDLVDQIRKDRPVIVGLMKPYRTGKVPHFEVVAGIHAAGNLIATIDPALGWTLNSLEGFLEEWEPTGRLLLIVAADAAEAAPLAGRAAEHPELEAFAAGQNEPAGYVAIGVALAIASAAVGVLAGCPLGYKHASREKGFLPAEDWNASTDLERFVYQSAYIFGFPLYGMGYLIGKLFPSRGFP